MGGYKSPLGPELVDQLCGEFESSWRSGSEPRIEEFLVKSPEASRGKVLSHLLELDFEYRRQRGENPTMVEYVSRFPAFENTIREYLSTKAMTDTNSSGESTSSTADTLLPDTPLPNPPAPNPPPPRSSSGSQDPAADRNLLFGVLAVQMDFVSREALFEAMNKWELVKSEAIGELLVEQGALPQETRKLLDTLVDTHVKVHDGDLEKSLASMGVVPSVREDLQRIHNRYLATTLNRIPTVNSIGDPENTPQAPANHRQPLRSSERFRVVRPHAKGGIGEVFVAEDLELSREVALKEIQSDFADDDESRERFLLEAEVTGGLEHPGIVPVYGFGMYQDGRPYYAMRFIHGESLQEAIAGFHAGRDARIANGQRRLELHKLLGRFIDVCNAIEYAHSRGVLHRDLKPANVMLGKYGETLVVDWGLAKSGKPADPKRHVTEVALALPLSSGRAPTRMGSIFGTPNYMPPEQAAGNMDKLGPQADVYSLGATLYHVLTGRPPMVGSDLTELIDNVKAGRFPKPRQINEYIPQSLEAVCLKAMALRPDDRYATPLELAEDIEHWLADEPVSAWREPFMKRAGRWIRRHQMFVTSAAVALVVALICLSAAIGLLNDAWQSEKVAHQTAQQNHRDAERHFDRARDAVHEFYTEVSEEALLHQPGLQPLRERLMTKALDYYEAFLDERGDDNNLRTEVADTWFRVGVITELVRSPEQSLEAYQRAREMQKALLSEQPDDLARLAALGDTINAMGRARQKQRLIDDAMADYQESQRLRQQIVSQAPENIEYHRKLANSHMNIGLVTWLLGDSNAALQELKLSQQMRKGQLQRQHDLKTLRDLGKGYYNLAAISLQDGDGPGGEGYLSQAIEAFEKVLAENPRDAANERQLAQCYRLMADRRLAVPDFDEAIAHYEKARARLDTLVIRNPDVPDFAAALAGVYLNLAEGERRREQPKDALSALRTAEKILAELTNAYPEAPKYRRDLAVTLRTLAELQIELEQVDDARRNLVSAREHFAKLLEQIPDDAELARQLAALDDLIRKIDQPDASTE